MVTFAFLRFALIAGPFAIAAAATVRHVNTKSKPENHRSAFD